MIRKYLSLVAASAIAINLAACGAMPAVNVSQVGTVATTIACAIPQGVTLLTDILDIVGGHTKQVDATSVKVVKLSDIACVSAGGIIALVGTLGGGKLAITPSADKASHPHTVAVVRAVRRSAAR
jgi:hypothetical protein